MSMLLHAAHSHIPYALSDSVFDLKEKLQLLTDVPFERQKILGLVRGKLPEDEATMYA